MLISEEQQVLAHNVEINFNTPSWVGNIETDNLILDYNYQELLRIVDATNEQCNGARRCFVLCKAYKALAQRMMDKMEAIAFVRGLK